MSAMVEDFHWPASTGVPRSEPFDLHILELITAAGTASATQLQAMLKACSIASRAQRRELQQQQAEQQQDAVSLLDDAAGVQLLLNSGFELAFGKEMLQAPGTAFPADHVFRAFVAAGLIQDERVYFKTTATSPAGSAAEQPSAPSAVLVAAYVLGPEACGHAGIVHGGITASLFDESLGELLYIAKAKGLMSFKYAVTASLEVSYKAPWQPAKAPVYVTAAVTEVVGRKIWVEAAVANMPLADGPKSALPEGCVVYATAKGLFLEPRAEGSSTAVMQKAAEGRSDQLGALPLA